MAFFQFRAFLKNGQIAGGADRRAECFPHGRPEGRSGGIPQMRFPEFFKKAGIPEYFKNPMIDAGQIQISPPTADLFQ